MNKIFFSLTVLLAFAIGGLNAQQSEEEQKVGKGPVIEFDKEVHDYGTIKKGADGSSEFTVKNTGDKPLVISRCKGSCGCTVPTCPKKPIAPGESAKIEVNYDTKRVGPINKSVRVSSNAENAPNKTLRIKGKVKKKAKTPTTPEKQAGAPADEK